MTADRPTRFPLTTIALLGVITIASYGAWAYSFGVLLDPLLDDTGWPEGAVAGGFAVSSAVGGLTALPAGRLLDAVGARRVFLLAATVSTTGLVGASFARSLPVYLVASAIGGAALSGLAFYHVTQTVAVRVAPDAATRSIAVLTIFGAFSSAIYLPLAAVLVDALGWRGALRVLASSAGAVLAVGALFVVEREPSAGRRRRGERRPIGLERPDVRRFLAATGCVGIAVGIILVYQVPLMVAAGLPLATAATMGGVRGVLQLLGRLPLMPLVDRFGPRGASRLAFASIGVGVALLGIAGEVWLAAIYTVFAGFGIGATSPLQGIYSDAVFERDRLGAAMGTVSMVFGLAVAIGPAAVGVLSDATGTRLWGVAIGMAAAAGAVVLLRPAAAGGAPTDDGEVVASPG